MKKEELLKVKENNTLGILSLILLLISFGSFFYFTIYTPNLTILSIFCFFISIIFAAFGKDKEIEYNKIKKDKELEFNTEKFIINFNDGLNIFIDNKNKKNKLLISKELGWKVDQVTLFIYKDNDCLSIKDLIANNKILYSYK